MFFFLLRLSLIISNRLLKFNQDLNLIFEDQNAVNEPPSGGSSNHTTTKIGNWFS